MSAFVDALHTAARGDAGITTGSATQVRTPWSEIHRQARAGAAVLSAAGVGRGDAVAVLAGAPIDVAPAVQAVWLAGGSVTMLHQPTARTRLDHFAVELQRTLQVIAARAVIVGEPFTDAAELLRDSGIVVLTVDELRSGDPDAAPVVESEDDDAALLQLTSGSTSSPKAVRITHGNLWANLEAMCAAAGLAAGQDVMVSWLPLFHDMGMVGFLTLPMSRGIDLVKVTPPDFLRNPLLWLELVSAHGGTCTAAPNFAYALAARVLRRAEGLDLSTLRFALNGAEPIDTAAVRAFLAAGAPFGLPDTAMVCAYGMAEATLGVSFHPRGTPLQLQVLDADALENDHTAVVLDLPEGSPGTRAFPVLGPPLDGIEVKVVRDGADLPEGRVGTLHVRGAAVTELYLTDSGPRPTRGDDGWLDTGDLGYLTGGRVVVCGRVKDVIIMGGRNIFPTDIERVAGAVDGVRAGNAVAVRTTVGGRREGFAVVVESRAADDPAEVERIAAHIRSAVTAEIGARPTSVVVVPVGALPKTPSGKMQRSAAGALVAPS